MTRMNASEPDIIKQLVDAGAAALPECFQTVARTPGSDLHALLTATAVMVVHANTPGLIESHIRIPPNAKQEAPDASLLDMDLSTIRVRDSGRPAM